MQLIQLFCLANRQLFSCKENIPVDIKTSSTALLFLALFATSTARADTEFSTNFSLSGTAFGQPFNSNLLFDDNFELRDYSVFNDARQSTNFGTLSRAARTLGRAPFDLSLVPEQAQTLSFGVPTGTAFTTLLAGHAQVERAPNRFDSTNFFGARVSHPIGDAFLGSVSLLRANNASDQSGRDIGALSLTWTPDINRRVNIEVARSRGGSALQINGGWRRNRVLAFAGLRRAGNDFLLLDNARIERRNGGFAYLDYALSPSLNIVAATQRFSDGARRRLRDDNLRFEYSNRKDFFAALSAFDQTRSGYVLENPLEEFFALQGRGVGARVAQNFGRTRLTAGASVFRNTRERPVQSNGDGTQFSLSARHYLRDGRTRLFANATLREEHSDNFAGGNRRSTFALAGVEHRFGKRRGPTISAAIDTFSQRSNNENARSYGLRVAAYTFINDSTSLNVSLRTPLSSSRIDNTNRVFLGITHRFGDRQRRFSLEEQRLLARVRGRVYEDRNLNGVFDAGERGLPDVRVQIGNGNRVVTTDSQGKYEIDNLIPGTQTVSLVTKTLPIEYSMLQNEYAIATKAARVFALDIAVAKSGGVSGTVFRDDNRNGVRDAGEIAVPNVAIGAGGSEIIAFSNSEGRFTFNDLLPRPTKLSVNIDTIARPNGEEWQQTREVQSPIPAGSVAPDVQIGVAPKPRETETTFQGDATK